MSKDTMGFTSSWAPFLAGFIREKRACGYCYETQVKNLRPLDRWWSEPSVQPSLSCIWAERFIAVHPGEAPGGPPRRASLWRGKTSLICNRRVEKTFRIPRIQTCALA